MVAELEFWSIGLPCRAVGQDGEILLIPNDEVLIEAAVESPASVGKSLAYLLLVHVCPVSFLSRAPRIVHFERFLFWRRATALG